MTEYEATYSTKRRAIFRWLAIGKEKGDPPPLDRPAEMLAWWTRRMKQRPPAKFLALSKSPASASAAVTGAAPPAGTRDTDPPEKKGAPAGKPVDFDALKVVDFSGTVRNLQIQLAAHQESLYDAMRTGADEATLTLRQRNVNLTIDLLRKCEATLDEQRKSRGDLVELADVQEDWGMLLAALAAMRERMPADVVELLAGARDEQGALLAFTPAQLAAIRAAVLAVRHREDTHLRGAKHWPTSAAADAEPPAAAA